MQKKTREEENRNKIDGDRFKIANIQSQLQWRKRGNKETRIMNEHDIVVRASSILYYIVLHVSSSLNQETIRCIKKRLKVGTASSRRLNNNHQKRRNAKVNNYYKQSTIERMSHILFFVVCIFITTSTTGSTKNCTMTTVLAFLTTTSTTKPTRTILRRKSILDQRTTIRTKTTTPATCCKILTPSSFTSNSVLYMGVRSRIRNSHSTITTPTAEDPLLSSKDVATVVNATTIKEEDPFTKAVTTKDIVTNSNPANSQLMEPKSISQVSPHQGDVIPSSPKVKVIDYQKSKRENKKKEQQQKEKKSYTTTNSKNKSNVTDKSTDTNAPTTTSSAKSTSYKNDKNVDNSHFSSSSNSTTIGHDKSHNDDEKEALEEDKENVLDAISRLAGGLLPTTTTQQQMEEKNEKEEQNMDGGDDMIKNKSWSDNNNNNPFDWRPPLNNLSFGSSSLSDDDDDSSDNDQEERDDNKQRQRRKKKQKKQKTTYYYRINPEEAKELDKSVVSFTSTDDAMMGIQVLPTTLSPTVVVASSSSSSLSNKQKKSSSDSTASNAEDNKSTTLKEKISKRRLIKNWTKEVLQSSSLKKNTRKRSNNSERSDVDNENDKKETTNKRNMIGGGRINRDIREVAVSIASNIDTIEQYKLVFNEEGGGDLDDHVLQQIFYSLKVSSRLINVAASSSLKEQTTTTTTTTTTGKGMDLLNTIHNNNNKGKDYNNTPEGFYYYYTGNGAAAQVHQSKQQHHHQQSHHVISNEDIDHAFATACTACRALRDLCALSPELSSIITEAILDASTASSASSSSSSSSKGNNIPGSTVDGTSNRSNVAPSGVVAALASLLEYSINKTNEHHEHGYYSLNPMASHHSQNQASPDATSATFGRTMDSEASSETLSSSSSSSRIYEEKARLCRLYIIQLCLAMTLSSDAAVYTLRQIPGLKNSIMKCSSFALYKEPSVRKRKTIWNVLTGGGRRSSSSSSSSSTFQSSSSTPKTMIMDQSDVIPVMEGTLDGRLRGASNQLLAALGYNVWVPKVSTSATTTTSSNGFSLDRRRSKKRHNKQQQQGLRILCIDGGGTRGIAAITSLQQIVRSMGGIEICDSFDIVAGTSTGAIISFLVALRRETSSMTRKRYDMLIKRIFVKSPLSTPMLVFTTASYDESHFMTVMEEILSDDSMLESRVHPLNPYVFAVSTKMSSTPTTVCLFRNYNYSGGELPDSFVISPQQAKKELGLLSDDDDDDDDNTVEDSGSITDRSEIYDDDDDEYEYHDNDDDDNFDDEYYDNDNYLNNDETSSLETHDGSKRAYKEMLEENTYVRQHTTTTNGGGSRNPGSFRIPQKVALRATTAAPTVFKPILMSGELYCDGGMLASNPTAIAIHEARVLFPDIPIDCVVSLGTGGFREVKSSPRIGWDGIITQIVNSATDAEQPHHILEDILGQGGRNNDSNGGRTTKYFRFNPMIGLPDDFPLDNTDPKSLNDLCRITQRYMEEPIQKQKLKELSNIMLGGSNNSDGVVEEEDDGIRRKSFLKRLLRL